MIYSKWAIQTIIAICKTEHRARCVTDSSWSRGVGSKTGSTRESPTIAW